MSKKIFALIIGMLVLIMLGLWYFLFLKTPASAPEGTTATSTPFSPFPRGNTTTTTTGTTSATEPIVTATTTYIAPPIPVLRQLYASPVGGMGATTTVVSATSSFASLRFIDRGTGHVYEAPSNSLDITKLSNTTLSRVHESYWNRSANGFVIRYTKPETDAISSFYAELRAIVIPKVASSSTATGTTTNTVATASEQTSTSTNFELRGKALSGDILELAVSPKKDKVFELVSEGGKGVGYISSFDERTKVQVFDTPLTQLNAEWPEENIITLTTKGTSIGPGYLYFFNIKNAALTRVLGGIRGLSALTSKDGARVFYSSTAGQTISNAIYSVKEGTSQDSVLRTLPEKCVWSNLHKEDLYCAVPSDVPADSANYPDAWYQGKVSFNDNIWQIDTNTGEVHQIASLLTSSGKLIDATNLLLDPKEDFLYFINKKDLSLWSLEITR